MRSVSSFMPDKDFWRVQMLGTTPSTQDVVRGLAENGEPEGLAVQALQQSSGRGRHGNVWTSPMGNLYLSLLLRPSCKADKAAQMAFVVALALSDAMDEVMDPTFSKKLKWPNDILIGGKKISGILLETKLDSHGRIDYLIVGTGVNIFAPPEGAEGLDRIKKERIAVNTFRDLYLQKLLERYISWQDKGFAPVREAWLKQAHGVGESMTIRLPEVSYEGTFEGVDDSGALIATIDGQKRIFTAGEVHFGVN
ncbi:MAG: biotin--[acetyl-CoA-carboxylase] ligase [Micavibrio aeruginosavorus]|uniref:biotin--[biotin carboxyl-carrier protein] ligase n=1 Tax=Micavibrio aeruginosavorus TaxID=349221 RepID=A0A2W5MS63_9BACT|nr:MAG: biotin--[acetyl-CoA-carboxylase] ligase [Micavibrio aeruginosavorus]